MSKLLNSWIEVTIPSARMLEPEVAAAIDQSIKVIGGATVTAAEGFYIREDTGSMDVEHVNVVRWDFSLGAGNVWQIREATAAVVDALLKSGEECVLRRRFYEVGAGRRSSDDRVGYKSELIFA